MSEKQPHSEQDHQLEALSRKRLMGIYETMLHKALDYRMSCDEAADAELRDSLSEWEEESDIPISDFAVLSMVIKTTKAVYERPRLVTATYQGDPAGMLDTSSPVSNSSVPEMVSIRLNVDDRVAKNLLPSVSIEVVISGLDSPDSTQEYTQQKLRLTFDESGLLIGDRDFVQSRRFEDDKTIYLTEEAVRNPQKKDFNLEEINAVVDSCLLMIETVIK